MALALVLLAAAPAPAAAAAAGVEVEVDAISTPDEGDLDARIAAVERALAADEAALSDYLSDDADARRLRDSGEIAAIARRLPQLLEELRALRTARGDADAP